MKNRQEMLARLFAVSLVAGLLGSLVLARWTSRAQAIEIHARLPEDGGFIPGNLSVEAGKPLHLRLVSDDVLHGFAIGQLEQPDVELKPGVVEEVTLMFARPGKYVFYCTRWCNPDHWRMRGTIEVNGAGAEQFAEQPLFVRLGLDIDAKHDAPVVPAEKPSAHRGGVLATGNDVNAALSSYTSREYYQIHSAAQAFQDLRALPALASVQDGKIWDLVAWLWSQQTTPEQLAQAEVLYNANCAACHGETGQGDGVFADQVRTNGSMADSHGHAGPANFNDPEHMLGASPALLHGKIVRGGMGTGMPYWGPIFTDEQVWSLVGYLWTFQFEEVSNP